MKCELAKPKDAAEIAALRTATNQDLMARHGDKAAAAIVTERWVRFRMRNERVYVMRDRGKIVATFVLAAKKPWSIDRKFLTPAARPLYLIEMAVAPGMQRKGVGRRCLAAAISLCRQWPADALWLDAYDAPHGAGGFYRKCGFREVGRAVYRKFPLIYFERRIEEN